MVVFFHGGHCTNAIVVSLELLFVKKKKKKSIFEIFFNYPTNFSPSQIGQPWFLFYNFFLCRSLSLATDFSTDIPI